MPKAAAKTIAPAAALPYFREDALKFLRGLKRNNNREWFEARRDIYERELKQPMLAIVERITDAMAEFAPTHVRPAQKSILRIYRDTSFSADKTPYKTNIAAWWTRNGLEKTSGAGFYFHITAQEVLVAAGIYMPEREQLFAIRMQMLEYHEEFRRLLQDRKLRKVMNVEVSPSLTRPPKGFPAEHPAMDLIRQKQWGLEVRLPVEVALKKNLVDEIVMRFRLASPVVNFLNRPFMRDVEKKKQYIFRLM